MGEIDYYKLGQDDARKYYESQAYAALSRVIKPAVAMTLFWPPVEESMVMFSSPLPKPRQDWIKGFGNMQAVILAEPPMSELKLEVKELRKKLLAVAEGKRTLKIQLEDARNRCDAAEKKLNLMEGDIS